MNIRIAGIFVPVTNLETSVAWYCDTLGATLKARWGTGPGGGASFIMPFGDSILNLVEVTTAQRAEFQVDSKTTHPFYNFQVQDAYEAHQQLTAKGVEVTDIEDEGFVIGFRLRDLEGNFFGMVMETDVSAFHKWFDWTTSN